VRLELHPDEPPGFRRVELTRPGPASTLDVSGTSFVVAPA
jgi:hypothetical protein